MAATGQYESEVLLLALPDRCRVKKEPSNVMGHIRFASIQALERTNE